MIVDNSPRHKVTMSGVTDTASFQMEASEEGFAILSNDLYSNKVRAVIRELSCNAYDSHLDAGKEEVPIQIHLPSELEPWFSVKDEGIGLDHDDVFNVFMVYFKSTKRQSANSIGAMGLGCKSPYSISDNFTITSIKDGMKRIYSAYLDDNGIPGGALMAEFETDEHNGITVEVPVSDDRMAREFRQEAKDVLKWFDVTPIDMNSGEPLEVHSVDYVAKDIIPGVHQKVGNYYNTSSSVVMGKIEYPISRSSLNVDDSLKQLLNNNLELHMSNGSVKFQPSREGLSYNRRTRLKIERILRKLRRALYHRFKEEVEAIDNHWDRGGFIIRRHGDRLWRSAVEKYLLSHPDEAKTIDYSQSHYMPSYQMLRFDEKDDLEEKFNIQMKSFRANGNFSRARTNAINPRRYVNGEYFSFRHEVLCDPKTALVITDTKVGAYERAKRHFGTRDEFSNWTVHVISAANAEKAMDSDGFIKELFDIPNVYRASELDEKPKRQRAKTESDTVIRLDVNRFWEDNLTWSEVNFSRVDGSDTKYYVNLKGYELDSKYSPTDPKTLIQRICRVTDITRVYGIRKGERDMIKGKKEWVNVEDEVIRRIKSGKIDPMKFADLTTFIGRDVVKYVKTNDSAVAKDSPFMELVKYGELDGRANRITMNAINWLLKRYKIDNVVNPEKVQEKLNDVADRYPLLRHLDTFTPPELIVKYVNEVDQREA